MSLNHILTEFAHWLERKLQTRRLLDIPRGFYWHIYYYSSYAHIVFSCILTVLSISCFCTGIQNSFMYDEINCSDGTSLAAPMANIFLIYYTLIALKQQGNYFAAFEQVVMSAVVFIFNSFFAIDQLLAGLRWVQKTSRTTQNWPLHFAVLDLSMFILLVLMNLVIGGLMGVYILLITDWAGWRDRARMNIERSQNQHRQE